MRVFGTRGPLHGSESIPSRHEIGQFALAPDLNLSDLAYLAQYAHTQRFVPTAHREAADETLRELLGQNILHIANLIEAGVTDMPTLLGAVSIWRKPVRCLFLTDKIFRLPSRQNRLAYATAVVTPAFLHPSSRPDKGSGHRSTMT